MAYGGSPGRLDGCRRRLTSFAHYSVSRFFDTAGIGLAEAAARNDRTFGARGRTAPKTIDCLNYGMPNILNAQRAKTAGLTVASARPGGHLRLPEQRTSRC